MSQKGMLGGSESKRAPLAASCVATPCWRFRGLLVRVLRASSAADGRILHGPCRCRPISHGTVLNHSSVTHSTVTAIYDRYRYNKEKRLALETCAKALEDVVDHGSRGPREADGNRQTRTRAAASGLRAIQVGSLEVHANLVAAAVRVGGPQDHRVPSLLLT